MAKRYFEFSEGTSNKFWEVWVEGTQVLTRYGKIGASGQTTVKDEGSADAAQKLHDKLVREKTGKGYVEQGGAKPAPAAAPAAAKAPVAAPAPKAAAPAAPVVVEPGYRRFEFSEGSSNKFWEVKVEDSVQVVRFGKIDTAGQEKEKDFDSPREAKADTKKLITEKVGKGYVEVGGKPKSAGNPELEAAIEQNLDDPNPYLVYADWLQAKGDPLGELIVVQHQAATDAARSKELEKTAKALITKNKAAFLGALADFPTSKDGKGIEIVWQFGFMKEVDLHWEGFDDGDGDEAAEDLANLLDLPTARFLQKLTVGPYPSEEEMSLQPLVDVLEEKKGPATLRELYLGNIGDWDISGTSTGDFEPLAKIFPRLERLTLRGGHIDLGKNVSLPELRELTVETGGLTESDIKDICSLKAPKLERLSVWFGDENYGAEGELKDIAPILAGTTFPKLTHLGIMNCAWVGDAVRALPKSKILKQLTSLDLSMGSLSDADVDAMLENEAAFKHLEHLNVEDSGLTPASKPKLARLAKHPNYGDEQEPERAAEDHYRYVSVGE